ncbi:hypothetical protein EDD18DRAFT_1226387 [Armillaria luteobubalina]|uniref:Secreted protein n=1 Tax=Armillaria luteobubalina TaxID=153913 RepID=A0AA39NWU2_9AGAR|nr:hypothetical protein EDD18DRAFT_1226387 [Armillaria luteobubalina]
MRRVWVLGALIIGPITGSELYQANEGDWFKNKPTCAAHPPQKGNACDRANQGARLKVKRHFDRCLVTPLWNSCFSRDAKFKERVSLDISVHHEMSI